jgi:hypothetical protein
MQNITKSDPGNKISVLCAGGHSALSRSAPGCTCNFGMSLV